MKNSRVRNSEFEFLRIISMFMIVLCHFCAHGTLDITNVNAAQGHIMEVNLFFLFLGPIGVTLFVLIGAYFLCEKKFNFRRPISLVLQTVFYSFILYLFFLLKDNHLPFQAESLKALLLPFPEPSGYWFVEAYLVLLILMPLLNLLIQNLTRYQLFTTIIGGDSLRLNTRFTYYF